MVCLILYFIFILMKFSILTPVDTQNLAFGCSPSYSDKKFFADYKSEGANKHMSSQGMLKQLVNSIIERCIHNTCRTV